MNTQGRHRRDSNDAPPPSAPDQNVRGRSKWPRRWFKLSFVTLQVVFLVWVVGGARSGARTPLKCGVLNPHDCNAAQNLGTAIGVGVIIVIWVLVDIVLGVSYAMARLRRL